MGNGDPNPGEDTGSELLAASGRSSPIARADLRRALLGGAVAALFSAGALVAIGRLGSWEARILIEAALPTMQFLTSAVIAAGMTVLALMLTLLGLSYTMELTFQRGHYRRVIHVSVATAVTIVASTLMLLVMAVPIQETEVLGIYYSVLYYALTIGCAVIGGAVVAVVLMLSDTVRSLAAVGLGQRSPLVEEDQLPEEIARRFG